MHPALPPANEHHQRLLDCYRTGRPPFPLWKKLGLKLTAYGRGRCSVELPVTPRYHNPQGIAHGGVIMGLIDTAMGFAATSVLEAGEGCATIDVKVDFIRPVVKDRITATARVLRRGRNILPLDCTVRDSQRRIVAVALGTAAIKRPA